MEDLVKTATAIRPGHDKKKFLCYNIFSFGDGDTGK